MTMPDERTRALLWAGSFLIEIAQDKSLPVKLRRKAVVIARHFPTIEEVESMSSPHLINFLGPYLENPSRVAWREDGDPGPLTYSTRLAWPEDRSSRRPAKRRNASPDEGPSSGADVD